jgi:hypothetical protein
MPDETLVNRIENLLTEVARLGGQNEITSMVSNLTIIDATPTGLASYIIIEDNRDGDYIPALKVPGVLYANSDKVNVLFIEGSEPVAFQQASGSSGSPVAVSKLVSPDLTIDPVISADNAGDVTLADGDFIFGAAGQISVTGALQINATGGVVVNEGGADADFRVEADAEPDAIFVDASKNVVFFSRDDDTTGLAIGSASIIADGSIRIVNDGSAQVQPIAFTNSGFPTIAARRARGTEAVPSAVQTGDVLFRMGGSGYHSGGGFAGANRADIEFAAAENWTSGAQGTYIRARTTTIGTTAQTERIRIEDTGDVGVGTTNPAAQLHVDQASTTAAQPVLYLDQADISEEMIEFNTTIGVGNAIEAVGAKTLTVTHFIKVTLPGGLTRYFEVGTIA